MEPAAASRTTEMVAINTWEDVAPFAGRVVAFRVQSDCFGFNTSYPIDDDETKYGCITYMPGYGSSHKDAAYHLWQLLSVTGKQRPEVGLDTPHLQRAGMTMRCLQLGELMYIDQILSEQRALWSVTDRWILQRDEFKKHQKQYFEKSKIP